MSKTIEKEIDKKLNEIESLIDGSKIICMVLEPDGNGGAHVSTYCKLPDNVRLDVITGVAESLARKINETH